MKAVVFDVDGTLLDVREGFFWRFQELTRVYDGAPVSTHMINASAHGTTEQLVRTLVRNTDVPFEDIMRRYQTIRIESYDKFVTLHSGVDELLPILKRMGIKVAALAPGDGLAVPYLERAGVRDHFDVIVTGERVSRPKPHPEGIDIVCAELGVEPHEVIMVGDTVVDILAGRNAGVHKTIGITHGFAHHDALRAAGADHVVHDIPSLLDVLE
jgi:HAD superfamily hydrolase (TIGR01509 family)